MKFNKQVCVFYRVGLVLFFIFNDFMNVIEANNQKITRLTYVWAEKLVGLPGDVALQKEMNKTGRSSKLSAKCLMLFPMFNCTWKKMKNE
jgi:hypothetical protein